MLIAAGARLVRFKIITKDDIIECRTREEAIDLYEELKAEQVVKEVTTKQKQLVKEVIENTSEEVIADRLKEVNYIGKSTFEILLDSLKTVSKNLEKGDERALEAAKYSINTLVKNLDKNIPNIEEKDNIRFYTRGGR